MDELQQEFPDQIVIEAIDAADPVNQPRMVDYSVRGHPVIIILDASGQTSARFAGAQPIETLRDAITAVIVQPD